MMCQVGCYMKIYWDLWDKYFSFCECFENFDFFYEILMQLFYVFKFDGVILFFDIFIFLLGMGIDFDIIESKGFQIGDLIWSMDQVDVLYLFNFVELMFFVGEVLGCFC